MLYNFKTVLVKQVKGKIKFGSGFGFTFNKYHSFFSYVVLWIFILYFPLEQNSESITLSLH